MSYQDLRDFLKQLESTRALHRITVEIDPYLEITEVSDRVLQKQGPALLFENPKGNNIPVLANLFGTVDRVALALGCKDINELRSIGEFLSEFKEPTPPKGLRDAWEKYPLLKRALAMRPKIFKQGACQEIIYEAEAVDLNNLPIQTCWPQDAGPLITWGLVATRSPEHQRLNLGIYRQQVIAKNKVIMRWLSHRGGALDYQAWRRYHGKQPFPLAVIIGADPATLLAAVIPIPDTLSEYAFAGLLRGYRTELVKCLSSDILVPAQSEIVLEGFIYPEEEALEGPFGDHTGYYNEAERFPIFTVNRITHRKDPIYHSTYTGRPPDEPSILGMSLNELFLPILKKQFPEIVDFYLPPEGCSYRLAIVTIKKQYPGHAKRVMMGIWSVLTQFMYTKFIVVTDDDINARNWHDVIWAITTRMDPARDTLIIENTPIDYLDFASPVSGLGSKIGFDATNKWQGETQRVWGRPINKNPDVVKKIDSIWEQLGFL